MRPPSLHGRGFVVTLRVFGESAPSDLGAVLELEALSLVLDHAELLAGDEPRALYANRPDNSD